MNTLWTIYLYGLPVALLIAAFASGKVSGWLDFWTTALIVAGFLLYAALWPIVLVLVLAVAGFCYDVVKRRDAVPRPDERRG